MAEAPSTNFAHFGVRERAKYDYKSSSLYSQSSLLFFIYFRTPGIAAELRAVSTARGWRYFLVRAAWATAAVCGFYFFLMIYFNQFLFFYLKKKNRRRPATAPPSIPRAAAAAAAAVVAAATAAVGHRPPIAESTRARARARGHLSTAEYKWLGVRAAVDAPEGC